jgi:hypothetical protein
MLSWFGHTCIVFRRPCICKVVVDCACVLCLRVRLLLLQGLEGAQLRAAEAFHRAHGAAVCVLSSRFNPCSQPKVHCDVQYCGPQIVQHASVAMKEAASGKMAATLGHTSGLDSTHAQHSRQPVDYITVI